MSTFLGIGLGPIQTGIFLAGAAKGGFDRIVIAEVNDALKNAVNAAGSAVKQTFFCANPLSAAGTQNLFSCIHIEKLIFQRGTAYITNQNIHIVPPTISLVIFVSTRSFFFTKIKNIIASTANVTIQLTG